MVAITPQIHADPGAPYSPEAEEAVLGSVILEPSSIYTLELVGTDFFLLRHQYIWDAMQRVVKRDGKLDHILLADELESIGKLADIGGRGYLIQLVNNTYTSQHVEVYAQLVQRSSIRRKLMVAADEVKRLAMDESLELSTITAKAEDAITLATSQSSNGEWSDFAQAASNTYDALEESLRSQRNGGAPGLPTGLRDLDAITGGFKPGNLIICAGRPGMGKSAFATTITAGATGLYNRRVGLISLEMSETEIVQRILSMQSGVNLTKIMQAQMSDGELSKVTETIGRIAEWPIYIRDKSGQSIQSVRAAARRLHFNHGLDLLIIDYGGLLHVDGKQRDRHLEMGEIARQLKELAKDLNIPVLCLWQLNRNLEYRADKRPKLADLRESGEVEQNADMVLFLYRDEVYNENTEFPNQADVIVAKYRNGATGAISLYYEKSLTKFMNASVRRVDLSDMP